MNPVRGRSLSLFSPPPGRRTCGSPCSPPPARGRSGGPGSRLAVGATLADALAVVAIASATAAAAAPSVKNLQGAVAIRSAASQVTAAFFRARAYAIARGVYVGLKFRRNGNSYEWTLYQDGNGNGIRTAEITRGVDRPVGVYYPWNRNDVRPGILVGQPVPDPSSFGSLDNPDDPIRFNNSDICSFSPQGESTPGSVYLWDGHDRMAVVRVYGRSAKVRTLYYRRGEPDWKP